MLCSLFHCHKLFNVYSTKMYMTIKIFEFILYFYRQIERLAQTKILDLIFGVNVSPNLVCKRFKLVLILMCTIQRKHCKHDFQTAAHSL